MSHPFGHGLELYFWSFVVALLIFAIGGTYAVYEAVRKILHSGPIESAWVSFLVVAISIAVERLSFSVARRELQASFKRVSL